MAKLHKLDTDYAQTPNWIAQDRRLSMKARGLWTYMQSFSNDWDFSIERIANSCDKEWYEAIRTWIIELEQFWYLERKKVMTQKWGWDMDYYLLSGVPDPKNPDQGYPDQDNRMNIKEIVEKEINTKEIETHCAIAQSESDKLFEAFWAKYPKKVGKRQALKSFLQALKREKDIHVIADGLKRFLANCEWKEERFIPHASTWLNGDRWLDQEEAKKEPEFHMF